MRALLLAAWVLFAAISGPAVPAFAQAPEEPGAAAPAAAPRAWQSLSPQQQQLLQSFQGKWDSLPSDKQQALARGSQRWINMTPEQRAGAQERFKQWRALPPEQRQQLRQRWQQFKALPPEQQQRIREQYQRFKQMPPEQRQALRRQWQQMTPEQRRGALQRYGAPHGGGGVARPGGPHPQPRRFPH